MSNKWKNRLPIRLDDSQFLERSDYIISNAIKGRGSFEEISEIFKQGYPIEKLSLLFESDNHDVLYVAIETCYEIGKLAKCFVNNVAEIMNKVPSLKTSEGIVWLADYAEEINSLADWMIVSFIEEENINDVIVALRVLSGISFGQLRGAKVFLLEHIPDSSHIDVIGFYLDNYQNENMIFEMMGNNNILMQRYAIAMASRYLTTNMNIREEALKIGDAVIHQFVCEKLQ